MYFAPLRWDDSNSCVVLLDQTLLPVQEEWLEIRKVDQMAEAIRMLRVRGAPAIGIAAAYGVVLAGVQDNRKAQIQQAVDMLRTTRPTAVNLFWALDRMERVLAEESETVRVGRLLREAHAIRDEDLEAGRKLGEYGLSVLEPHTTVMTHCHAGGVATSGYGTALAPFFVATQQDFPIKAMVGETRPLLQGSRITAWELQKAGIDATLITDSMAGLAMKEKRVQAVLVGADRIAANGDVANKIGTYSLAVLAQAHQIPFYVSAPLSTIDTALPNGEGIPIEERNEGEITMGFGRRTAPKNIKVYNPAFDVTPAHLISAIITERGVLYPPYNKSIAEMFLNK